jgi:putative lipoprotein
MAGVIVAVAGWLVLGEQAIQATGNHVPFTVEIGFDPAEIRVNHTYAGQARIEDNGKLRFISDQHYAAITRGAPSTANILLKPVGGSRQ